MTRHFIVYHDWHSSRSTKQRKIIKGDVCVCYLIKQKFLEGKTWSSALRRAHVCVCENVGQKTRNKFFLKYKNCGSDN
jgi:hypothetical protein